ncbi:MAG: Imm50 family immunity protein [Verrucomicrobiota bacterium]|jgi:hypothetical protein
MLNPERQIDGNISKEILTKIRGNELVISHFGFWPTFEDFEVFLITLERAPWPNTINRDLRVIFSGFDINKKHTDPERKQALVEIQFEEIADLKIDGFNHQNPIMGLSIKQVVDGKFQIEWGGTVLKHDVFFICNRISVLRVVDLNPFRKSIEYRR